MEYKIIETASSESLSKRVNEHLQEGWELKGSHQIITKTVENRFQGQTLIHENYYSQTMIRALRK